MNQLYAISAAAPDDIWAVGYYGVNYPDNNLTMHWNGTSWTVVDSPSPDGVVNQLTGVAAISPDNAWAVGYRTATIMHWDGTAWTVVHNPGNPPAAIAAVSSTDVWTVGSASVPGYVPEVLRYHVEYCPTITPTITITITPTHTPTTPATSATPTPTATPALLGHVIWQGLQAQPSSLQQQPITLTLKLGENEVNYPPMVTDSSGFFTVPVGSLAPGTYSWRAKGPKYLANAGTVALGGAPQTSMEMGLMRAGDANNDNLITIIDLNIMKLTFGLGAGDPSYDDRADFSGDQQVTGQDFNLLKINFGQGGAPPIRPGGP